MLLMMCCLYWCWCVFRGNYEDERPYVEGDWCSSCPENLQKCENNLCGTILSVCSGHGQTMLCLCCDYCFSACLIVNQLSRPSISEFRTESLNVFWTTISPVTISSVVSFLVPDTVDEDEEVTESVFPSASFNPPLQPTEEEEEKIVPPPATTDPYIQPATTTTASTTTTTASTTTAWHTKENQPPTTPAPGTYPPEVYPTPADEDENTVEEKVEEEVETSDQTGAEQGIRDVVGKTYHNVLQSSASASLASLLLVCLSGILVLRLWGRGVKDWLHISLLTASCLSHLLHSHINNSRLFKHVHSTCMKSGSHVMCITGFHLL